MSIRYFLIVFTTCHCLWSSQAFSNLVIDDFKSGSTARIPVVCGLKDLTQTGSMAGGTRRTRLIVSNPGANCNLSNKYRQTASLQVKPVGAMILNSDNRVFHRLEVLYGQDALNNIQPLNLDLTEGNLNNRRIRIAFDSMDVGVNFNIVVFMNDGSSRTQCGINFSPGPNPFVMDFPLANFGTALGTPDYTDVDYIALIFQSGSAVGSNDYAVKSVITTNAVTPGVEIATCS